MRKFVLLLETTVTAQAVSLDIFWHQTLFRRGMGFMAGSTLILIDGLVDNALFEGLFRLLVAGIAQFALFIAQKALEPGNMRIMTGSALAGTHRFMHHLALKQGLVVATETGILFGRDKRANSTEQKTTDDYE